MRTTAVIVVSDSRLHSPQQYILLLIIFISTKYIVHTNTITSYVFCCWSFLYLENSFFALSSAMHATVFNKFSIQMQDQGRVLSLIAQDPNDEQLFVVCTQTIKRMKSHEGDFCFISICGDYRSGKSFLLNALFPHVCGFETSPTTSSCTRGINVWSRPLKQGSLNIWLIDTEGFGSIQKDADHDGRLFLLNLLLSNLLLYNSVGAIDEHALAKLALVCRHAAALDRSAARTKLFWVLRDFALEMADRTGRILTADQYLEECLKQGHGGQRAEKQFLRGLFQERHCVTLIRPLIDEQKLGTLKETSWQSLRQEFRSGVSMLRSQLLESAEGKEVNGVRIHSHNFQLLLEQFVAAVNGGDIDCGLNCTYERILQYEQAVRKQKIEAALTAKVEALKRLMPVQLQHLNYLRQQLSEIIKTNLQDLEGRSTPVSLQLATLQLQRQADILAEAAFKQNAQKTSLQADEYLYRQLVQVCPKLVVLGQQGFQARFQQAFNRLKEDFSAKYASFLLPEALENIYSRFALKEQRKIFFELAKRWRSVFKDCEERVEELKRGKRVLQQQSKKAKQQKEKVLQSLEGVRKEEARNFERMKQQVEQAFREEAKIIATGYQTRMQEQSQRWQADNASLRAVVERVQAEQSQARTQMQYQRQALQERTSAERQRCELLSAKWEQARSALQLQLEQTKNALQNKLRIAELKHNDLQATLISQRRKYQLISEERKSEEARILQQLAERNHRIDELNEQLSQLQGRYRGELERILLQEKDILCKTLTSKLNDYDYRCKAYQARLAEASAHAQERDIFERKNEQLELENRQLQAALQQEQDRIILLASRLKKNEVEMEQLRNALAAAREQHLREVGLLNENLLNSKNFMKQADQRHIQQMEWQRSKLDASLRQQAEELAQRHTEALEAMRSQLEMKWQQERTQMRGAIRNSYEEAEGLRMALLTITVHTDKVATILSRVIAPSSNNPSYNTSHLTDIAEELSEDTDSQSPAKRQQLMRQTQFLAQEVQQAFLSLKEEVERLSKERVGIREELKTSIEQLQTYQNVINKLKQENRVLRSEAEDGKRRAAQAEAQLRDRTEVAEKDLMQLRKEIESREKLLANTDEHHRQNSLVYKQTIAVLKQQNRQLEGRALELTINNETLQNQLQRFEIWATQVKAKSTPIIPPPQLDISADKIRDLQIEIKRLTRQVQESKTEKIERRQINLYSPLIQQSRANQLQALRAQNDRLLKQLQEKQLFQAKTQEERRINRRQTEQEQARYTSLKEEYEAFKRRSKDTIALLQSKINVYQEQNRQMKQEFQQLEDNIMQKYDLSRRMIEQQAEDLRRQKQSLTDFYSKKIQTLQETLNGKSHEADKRIAEADLRFQQFKDQLQKEHNRIILQGERHRLKYEHLLKVNGELIKEVEALKSKAHQVTIKEKYKSRISSLFDD